MADFLTSYHREVKKNGRIVAAISPLATDLANVTGHHFSLTWQDIADLREEVKRLKERIERAETGRDQE